MPYAFDGALRRAGTPFGLAITTFSKPEGKLFYGLGDNSFDLSHMVILVRMGSKNFYYLFVAQYTQLPFGISLCNYRIFRAGGGWYG
jgi:hypothetical protein